MIDNLEFNVAQLLKDTVGTWRHVEAVADLNRLVPELSAGVEAGDAQEAVIRGPIRLMHTNAGILVHGRLEGDATLACARCLEPVSVPIEVELEELYVPTVDMVTGKFVQPEEEDRALWIDEHHILDLSEVVRQDVLLTMPVHTLCQDDCKGLCPTCGQNLNDGPCDCQPEIDPRWGALSDLLKGNGNHEPTMNNE